MSRKSTSADKLQDSGKRREFSTGGVRDQVTGKGAFHLLPPHAVLAIAKQMERGAAKYSARNWELGLPLSSFIDSAVRHGMEVLAGYDNEPHDDAFIWNVACYIETKRRIKLGILPKELDDLPKTFAGLDPTE